MKKIIAATISLGIFIAIAIAKRELIYSSLSESPVCSVVFSDTTCKLGSSSSSKLSIDHHESLQRLPEQAVAFDLTRFDVDSREDLPFDSANASSFFMISDKDPYKIGTSFKGFDQRAKIVDHPILKGRSALRIELPQGEYGTSKTGVTAKIPFEISSDRVYLDYSFSFLGLEEHSDSLPQLGKLLGLCIAECATGKRPSNGTNGASARISYRSHRADKMALFGYLYHLGQKNDYGTYFPAPYIKAEELLKDLYIVGTADSNYPTIKLGDRHINYVRMIVDLNTPGKADGEVEIYLNGRLVSHAKEIVFRKSSKEKFSGIAFDIFHGGGSNYRIPINASVLIYEVAVVPL